MAIPLNLMVRSIIFQIVRMSCVPAASPLITPFLVNRSGSLHWSVITPVSQASSEILDNSIPIRPVSFDAILSDVAE